MLDYPCDNTVCALVSIQDGHCNNCHRRFCASHNLFPLHSCPPRDEDDGMINHYAAQEALDNMQIFLDEADIFGCAQSLRPYHKVISSKDINIRHLAAGLRNLHVNVDFDDGSKWLTRIPRSGYYAYPRSIQSVVRKGEVDVLRWLRSVPKLPVPAVMSPVLTRGTTDFYFQEFLSGKPHECDFYLKIPLEQLKNTITDLAKMLIRISEHPFDKLGSLYLDQKTGAWTVGPYINAWAIDNMPPHYPGPFETAGEKWAYICEDRLRAIRAKSLHRSRTEDALIIFTWIHQMVLSYPPLNMKDELCYFMHEDFKWDVILADEEGHITGLIDWEWASIAAKCEAFAAPFGLMDNSATWYKTAHNRLSMGERLLADTYTELGRPDLARCVEEGKVYQRLNWIFSDVHTAWTEYSHLRCLGEAMGIEMPEKEEEWMELQRVIYKEELAALRRSKQSGMGANLSTLAPCLL